MKSSISSYFDEQTPQQMIAGMNGGKVTKNSQGNKKLQKFRCFQFYG